MCALDKQAEDWLKSPSDAAIVDPSFQEVVWQEVEKPVERVDCAQEILGCHTSLVVSDFLFSNFCCVIEYFVLIVLLLVGSGQTSRGTGRVPSSGWRGSLVDV